MPRQKPPYPSDEELIRCDKRRGALLGLVSGEALGSVAAGLTRDEILTRHGRIVHLPEPPSSLPFTDRVVQALESRSTDAPAPPPDGCAVAAAAVLDATLFRPPQAVDDEFLDAAEQGALRRSDKSCARLARGLAELALAAWRTPPDSELRAAPLLERLAPLLGDELADRLREQVRTAPSPSSALKALGAATGPERTLALVAQALLLRRRSVEGAVVWAVNLGGEAATRGALTGLVAGLHRGAASVPERWCRGLPGLARLVKLAAIL